MSSLNINLWDEHKTWFTPLKIIKIDSCQLCPHFQLSRDYTEDSFETCYRWFCKEVKKDIRRYVDWNDREKFIPDWCPLPDLSRKASKK